MANDETGPQEDELISPKMTKENLINIFGTLNLQNFEN